MRDAPNGRLTRDSVFLSGIPVWYSYDPKLPAEAREIAQIRAATLAGRAVFGSGRLELIESVCPIPQKIPATFVWVKPNGTCPWRDVVRVRVGRATTDVQIEIVFTIKMFTDDDEPARQRAALDATANECRKRFGSGRLVLDGDKIRYVPG